MSRITREGVGTFLGYAVCITVAILFIAALGGICEGVVRAEPEPEFPYVVEWFEAPEGRGPEVGISKKGQYAFQTPGGSQATRLIPLDQLSD